MAKNEDKKNKKRGPGRPPKSEGKKAKGKVGRPAKNEGKKRGPGRPAKGEGKKDKGSVGRPPKSRAAVSGGFRVTVMGNLLREMKGKVTAENNGVLSVVHAVGKATIQQDVPEAQMGMRLPDGRLFIGGIQIVGEFVAQAYEVEGTTYSFTTEKGPIMVNGAMFTVNIETLVEAEETDEDDEDEDEEEAPKGKKSKKAAKAGKKGGKKAAKDEDEDEDEEDGDLDAVDDDEDEDSDEDGDDEDEDGDEDGDEEDGDEDGDDDDEESSEEDEDDSGEWNI